MLGPGIRWSAALRAAVRGRRAATCRRAAEKRDELPSSHSITSSASASNVAGIVEAERFGGLEIDDEIEFGRLLDRDVGRLRSAQNLVDKVGGAPE